MTPEQGTLNYTHQQHQCVCKVGGCHDRCIKRCPQCNARQQIHALLLSALMTCPSNVVFVLAVVAQDLPTYTLLSAF
eukprot:5197081-Amphidinium_carterae.1